MCQFLAPVVAFFVTICYLCNEAVVVPACLKSLATTLYHWEKCINWAQAGTSGLLCIFGAIFGMFFA
jgi:hypothetical protein